MRYTDIDGNTPSYVKVYIDGQPRDMSFVKGNYTSGAVYRYRTALNAGSHTYYFSASDGTDTVRLPASGSYSGPVVETPNIAPTASFTYSPTSPTTDNIIQFTDQSTDPDGTIAFWYWDFGDGATSTLQNPTYNYSSAGAYAVTLTVTDNRGATSSVSKPITVSVPPAPGQTLTTLSISPLSFAIQSGDSITLTATLRDENNDPLAGKSISWSATTGVLSTTSRITDSLGQASITFTAPTVTTQTTVTITACFGGDVNYKSSSATSAGTITAPLPTVLSVSPSSFILQSGSSITLAATLTDADDNPLTNKTITWSATAGNLSATSGTTVTYTAPSVTDLTTVTITASFAGDENYAGSQATSVGIISPTAQTQTSIIISPLVLDAESGENVLLTVLLTAEGGVPLAGKAISLSTTHGTIIPASGLTDSIGMITATFVAPSVDVRTSFILTASFTGDNEYSPTTAYSTGTIRSAELAESVEEIRQMMEKIEVEVQELEKTLEAIENAIVENKLGLGRFVVVKNDKNVGAGVVLETGR